MSRHEAVGGGVGGGTVMLAFIAGSLAGAAVALLFAPAAGDETRQFLNEKAREGRERAAAAANAATQQGGEFLRRQREGVQNAVDRGRRAYEEARAPQATEEPM
jgi:gas vesicle protein